MKKNRTHDEISAYLDGEASDPDAVARLIQKDADAARRYMELSKLSAHMKAMSASETGPDFCSRVLKAVEEIHPPKFAWRPVLMPAAAFAILVIAAAVAWFELAETPRGGLQTAQGQRAVKAFPEEALEARLQTLSDEYVESAIVTTGFAGFEQDAWTESEIPTDELLTTIASPDTFAEMSDELDAEDDLDSILARLNQDECEAFEMLLREYAEKEWAI